MGGHSTPRSASAATSLATSLTDEPVPAASAGGTDDAPANTLVVKGGLDQPWLPGGHRVKKVLAAALARVNIGRPEVGTRQAAPGWTAAHFGLDRVGRFTALDEERRERVLHAASQQLLHEAFFIERLGLAFGAKMTLLSETADERMLYALFSADEARHLHAVAAHVEEPERLTTDSPFHLLLEDLIEHGDKPTLTFLIQVVLEGWGLTHYRNLADRCTHPVLAGVLRGILEDEARHHGSGKVLFEERGLPASSTEYVGEVLARFLQMVRMGPQGVLAALDVGCGGLSPAEKRQVLTELDGPGHARERLELLRRLMDAGPAARPILQRLEEQELFVPLPVEACA